MLVSESSQANVFRGIVANMSATESKEDFLAFRGLLDTLECLVNIRDKFPGWPSHFTKTIEDCIVHTAGRLTELDVNTSEFNAFEELERLATIKPKIKAQNQTRRLHYDNQLDDKHLFDTLIDSKIDFIKKGSFGRLTRGAGVGPLAALESLAEVTTKLGIYNGMNELLTSKMKEVVYAPEPQASLRNAPVVRRP